MRHRKRIWLFALLALSLPLWFMGCGGGGGDESPGGGNFFKANGGAGDNNFGGGGGNLWVDSYADVRFTAGGAVDAGFGVPTYPVPFIEGTRPAVVSANTVVNTLFDNGSVTEPAAGTLYLVSGRYRLFKSNGDGQAGLDNDAATSLDVKSGAILTLGLNESGGLDNGMDYVALSFENDVNIAGTVKTMGLDNGGLGVFTADRRHGDAAASGKDKGALSMSAFHLTIAPSGKIDTAGLAGSAGTRGGDGGAVGLFSGGGAVFNKGIIDASGGNGDNAVGGEGAAGGSGGAESVGMFVEGVVINEGAISASGGNGTTAGNAGDIVLFGLGSVYNTAALTANGGTSGSGSHGGYGGDVIVATWIAGSTFNRGAISANGGDGGTGGGDGGYVELSTSWMSGYPADLKNAGNISNKGGNATAAGHGGEGGAVTLGSRGKNLNSGSIVSTGGNGKGNTSRGGSGAGYNLESNGLWIFAWDNADPFEENEVTPGPIRFSGSVDISGGNGGQGGHGGTLEVDTEYAFENIPSAMKVEFMGFATASLNGGAGVINGGHGGDVEIDTDQAEKPGFNPNGSVFNNVPFTLQGGAASAGPGGGGGSFDLATWGYSFIVDPSSPIHTTCTNAGALDVSGGNGTTNGGDAGDVFLYGQFKVENSGAIHATGGAASGSTGIGGFGADSIDIFSTYDAVNNGAITASGGAGTGTNANGQDGGSAFVFAGRLASNSGNILANGGNGNGTGVNGDGGDIELFSLAGASTNSAGLLSVAKGSGGTGLPAAEVGDIIFDGVNVTPVDGTLP